MQFVFELFDKHKTWILVALLCCFGFSWFFMNRAHVEVTIDAEKRGTFEVYWAKEDAGYSQWRRVENHFRSQKNQYDFYMTDLRKIDRLRIDPLNFAGEITIKKLKISQLGYGEITFQTEEDWQRLIPLMHVEKLLWSEKGMTIVSNGNDPMFEFKLPGSTGSIPVSTYIISFSVIFFLVWLIVTTLGRLNDQLRYVPMLLFGVLLLITVIAATTVDRYHPDEHAHVAAAEYYKEHWIPPLVEDESIRHTYSVYGASRLNSGEIYYFFAGKFAKLLEILPFEGFLPYRLFNVFLFGLIWLRTMREPQTRLLAFIFLISPQLWYAFSYCTSDAFALFVAFGAGCQVLCKDSFLNRFLREPFSLKRLVGGLTAGLCLGLLFLLKANFYPFVAGLFVVMFVSWLKYGADIGKKQFLRRISVVCLVAICILGVHKGIDISVNGFDKHERVVALANEIADPLFNMTSPLDVRSPLLTIKERGQSLHMLLFGHRWIEKSFRSAFGVYGHTIIMGPEGFYDGVRWLGLAFFVFFFGSVFLKSPGLHKLEALVLLGISAALVGASIHHSWTMEIQAQGRYLFPIFSMFALVYARNYRYINARFFTVFVSGMFLLSTYSFITEAIGRIPR